MNGLQSEQDAIGRVADAFLARYRRGERPSLTEYVEKFPELAEQIRDLFPALAVMEALGSVKATRTGSSAGRLPGGNKEPEQLGDYRILREVGRGGMGIVYEAVQESLGRHVALKVLSHHDLLPRTHLERFRREARAAARLHHTNIVPVHGVGEHEGVHYFAMQFIQGQGLDEVLKEVKRLRWAKGTMPTEILERGAGLSLSLAQGLFSGHFPGAGASVPEGEASAEPKSEGSAGASPSAPVRSDPPASSNSTGSVSGSELTGQPEAQYFRSVARMGIQVAAGLDYAHKQGILHRDIKPSNLLLDARGIVWITDFGLAKSEGTDELTRTGDIVGTLRYMAPERFRSWSDPRSDVYALGITLYELLTLRPAFRDILRSRLIARVMHDDPPRPRKVDRSIPRDLETIVLKAIAKEPGRRYQSAAELAEDLGRFLAGEPVRARRIGVWERVVKWVKRRPAVAALLAVSAAAAVCLIAGTLIYNARLGVALRTARLAEQARTRQLAVAHISEAQARRNGGQMGRRFESLEALKNAAEHFRALGELDEQRKLELRNEAIACLALTDLKPGQQRAPEPGWIRLGASDPTLKYYVVTDYAPQVKEYVRQGHLSIRRIADDHEIAFLPGFGMRAVGARFSPDGRYLAAEYEQGQRHNHVWDLHHGRVIVKTEKTGEVPPAFSPDSRLVALAQPDKSIRIAELPSGRTWKELPPDPPPEQVQFHPDGLRLSEISGDSVRLRDLGNGKELATFKHASDVSCLAWRGDGKVFATACSDCKINVWDVANPAQPLQVLKGHNGVVVHLTFTHGGDLLFSISWDSTDRLWDPMTGQQLVTRPGGVYRDHCFGPDDRDIDDGWQLAAGRECRTFHGPKSPTKWVAISPEGPFKGRLIASVCADGARLWDLAATREGDKLLATLPVGPSLAVHFDPKGESLITDSKHVGLQRWPIALDPETGGLQIGPPHSPGLSARAPIVGNDPDFTISADGRTIAHSQHRGHALLFDWDQPSRKHLIESPYLRHAAFSPDGRWLATGNWQGHGAKVWHARTGEWARDLDLGEPDEGTACPAFSPDGQWLVVATVAEYHVWHVASWQRTLRLARENAGKSRGTFAFSPDSSVLAVLHSLTEVRLVDPETGREFARLPTTGLPYCFSPDGSQLVTYAGRDNALHVWDLRLIRKQLKELSLDWDRPFFPPPPPVTTGPLRVKVQPAEAILPSKELDAEAHRERGFLYLRMRNHAKATADFKRAGELNPARPQWDDVIRAYSQLIERHPEDAEGYHHRAHAHERLGHWEQAINDHSRAIKLAPSNLNIQACWKRAMVRADQFAQGGGRRP